MLKEILKNVFDNTKELPVYTVRHPRMDAQLIVKTYGVPRCLRARNGKSYLYFEYVSGMNVSMMRQMGLKPQLHHSKYSFYEPWVCRVPLSDVSMSDNAWAVVGELVKVAADGHIELEDNTERYNSYIERFKPAFLAKTR